MSEGLCQLGLLYLKLLQLGLKILDASRIDRQVLMNLGRQQQRIVLYDAEANTPFVD